MAIIFNACVPVKSARTARFGAGLFVQKADRLPIGPNDADREYAASVLNADTDQYSTEDGDWQTHEARTVSRREWLALQTEMATERYTAAMDAISDRLGYRTPEEAEVAETGSQVGHLDTPADDSCPTCGLSVPDGSCPDCRLDAPTPESILTPADIALLERMGQPMDNGPEWVWTDAMLDECEAEVAAKDAAKKARKPAPKTIRQINRAARKAAKA